MVWSWINIMIIGSIVAIFILVWFYHTASGFGRNPIHWAIAGVMVYFTTALFWTFVVNPGIKDAAMHNRDVFLMFFVRYAYIAISLAVSLFFNLKVGPKNNR